MLADVGLAVDHADADDGDGEVGTFLEVVAGEDAQSTGVDGERGVEAVLRGEIGEGRRNGAAALREPAALGGLGTLEIVHDGVVSLQKVVALGGVAEDVVGEQGEHADGVVVAVAPGVGIEGPEEVPGGPMPAPPEVVGQPAEALDALGEVRQMVSRGHRAFSFQPAAPRTMRTGQGVRSATASVMVPKRSFWTVPSSEAPTIRRSYSPRPVSCRMPSTTLGFCATRV